MSTAPAADVSTGPDRTPLGGLGALLAAGSIALVAGPFGIAGGISLLLVWALNPGVYAFALGQLLCAILVPDQLLVQLSVAQGGLLLVLFGSTTRGVRKTAISGAVVLIVLVGTLTQVRGEADPVWPGAVALVVVVGLLAYALHRYELVVLGLVEGDT